MKAMKTIKDNYTVTEILLLIFEYYELKEEIKLTCAYNTSLHSCGTKQKKNMGIFVG
jgi:hypothetical protein